MLSALTSTHSLAYEVSPVTQPWHGTQLRDLHNEYHNIFKRGNRNAASHLWSTFLLERAHLMSEDTLAFFFTGFCAVSGSPTRPSSHSRYKMTLDTVTGKTMTGFTYYCCWPCVCDTQDFIRVDTKNVTTKDGEKQFHFLVIGNPCEGNHDRIPWQAPEVVCNGQELVKAVMSDHGFVIISMFLPYDPSVPSQSEDVYEEHCKYRKRMGYNSGMGKIFREVAGLSPIRTRTADGRLISVVDASGNIEAPSHDTETAAPPTCETTSPVGCAPQ